MDIVRKKKFRKMRNESTFVLAFGHKNWKESGLLKG